MTPGCFALLVDDDPLWLVAEVPVGTGPALVLSRHRDRLGAEFEVLRLNEELKARRA